MSGLNFRIYLVLKQAKGIHINACNIMCQFLHLNSVFFYLYSVPVLSLLRQWLIKGEKCTG